MKECSICKKQKPTSEFYISGKYLYPQCKPCKRLKDKNTYRDCDHERNRRKLKEKKSRRIRRLKAKILVYGILMQSKCIDCGEARFETLDFDHVIDQKDRSISAMVAKGLKIEIIEKEILKCEVRCANCHRIKTSKQLAWERTNWSMDNAKRELEELVGKPKP